MQKHTKRVLKRIGIAIVATAMTVVPLTNGSAFAGEEWTPTFTDNFDDPRIDERAWGIYEGDGNGGVGIRSRNAVVQEDGVLKITGRGDVSGGLGMNDHQTYGRWEIRAKIDQGAGFGSGILLWPSTNWPENGELDISEIPDGDRSWSGSYNHFDQSNRVLEHKVAGDFSEWHTWALEWTPDRVTTFLDGEEIWNVTDGRAVPHTPHFLALQFDVGADGTFIEQRNSSTPEEVTMHVDYVKVYERS